ncbi:hypothetical protein [Virgibacillus sp. 6R]|uniref:hypothetical protein n=1 Tax=Metabacillus sp. 22489 TaxID=3453928 RepID=UPI0011A7947C
MVYRPTVRYADEFKKYVDDLFHATTLDRNQIIRAALFSAAFSPNFESLLKKYKKADALLPLPKWNADQHGYWLDRNPPKQEGGKDVNAINTRTRSVKGIVETDSIIRVTKETNSIGCESSITRREGEVSAKRTRITNQGGITIKIG